MLQRSGGSCRRFTPHAALALGVFSVKPGCHSSGSIRNLLVYLPPAHRVKKTRGKVTGWGEVIHHTGDWFFEVQLFESLSLRVCADSCSKHKGNKRVAARRLNRDI